MDLSKGEVSSFYGNRLRVRVCGICFQDDSILLVKHEPLGEKGFLWAPPGGGMDFGEDARSCVAREFKEETGLQVRVNELLFVHEFLKPPLHALELFFLTSIEGGKLEKGADPEMAQNKQLIRDVKFFSFDELNKMDRENLHTLFSLASSKEEVIALNGYFKKNSGK